MYVAGHRDEAAARWAAIIDEEPAHTPALFHIAQWHGQSGRPTEALTYYRRFMAVPRDTAFSGTFEGPQRSQWLLRYALAAKEAGFAQEALVASEQAATLTPGDHAARFQTGNLLIKLKRFEEAVAHLEAAAALRPTDAHTLAAAGYAMFKIGQLDAAAQRLNAAVQADPNFALGWYHLGTVYQQLGQRDEAIAAFSMAVRLKPRFRQARQALEALQQGR
jgi:tetratricopeptide (TPR) repeat protein